MLLVFILESSRGCSRCVSCSQNEKYCDMCVVQVLLPGKTCEPVIQAWYHTAHAISTATHQAELRYSQHILQLTSMCWKLWIMETVFKKRQTTVMHSVLNHRRLHRALTIWTVAMHQCSSRRQAADAHRLSLFLSSWKITVCLFHLLLSLRDLCPEWRA